jgi:hypothetical protein
VPRTLDGAPFRTLAGESAGIVVPLHDSRDYVLGARLRVLGAPEARLRILMNDRVLGVWELTATASDNELAVPAAFVRPGRNALRFKRPGEGPWPGQIAVAGAWLEPGSR